MIRYQYHDAAKVAFFQQSESSDVHVNALQGDIAVVRLTLGWKTRPHY